MIRLLATQRNLLTLAGSVILTPGVLQAQTLPPPPAYGYEVATIKPADPGERGVRIGPGPQGGMHMQNTTALNLLTFAYDMREFQFANIPGWVRSEHWDVTFTPDKPEKGPGPGMTPADMEGVFSRQRQRMQAVLRDRFGLVLRAESREMPVYALTVAKGGHKLKAAEDGSRPRLSIQRGQLNAEGVPLRMFVPSLASMLGRPVIDETGLTGQYSIKLEWTPDSVSGPLGGPGPDGPSEAAPPSGGTPIFAAVEEQLGLKLESKKGTVPVFVIEKIEKPSEN